MPKFVTKRIELVKGKQEFQQLIILSDEIDISKIEIEKEKGQLDIYEDSLEKKYKSSFNKLVSIMNAVANLKGLPDTQWKDVTPVKESVKEYEIKAGDLRMFVIKIPYGKLVVLGGYKNNQKEDFKKFRSLKAQYLSNH